MEQSGEYVSVQDVAEAFEVSTRAVWLWVRSGRIQAIQPGGRRGKYRIPAGEIDRLKAASATESPPEAERRSA